MPACDRAQCGECFAGEAGFAPASFEFGDDAARDFVVLEEREQVLFNEKRLFDAFSGNPAAAMFRCFGGFSWSGELFKVVQWSPPFKV